MPQYTPVDLFVAAVAIVILPIASWWRGRALARATGERRSLVGGYLRTIVRGLGMMALVFGAWILLGREFTSLGFDWPIGNRGLVGLGLSVAILAYYGYSLVLKKRSATELKAVGERLKHMGANRILPRTRGEHLLFPVMAVVGSCFEEIVYRGFLFWLITPFAGVVGAIVVSSLAFGLAHAYLGRASIIRTGGIGAAFGIAYAATGSLWWLMIAHMAANLFAVPLHRKLLRDVTANAAGAIAA